jgi:hypothetical protein
MSRIVFVSALLLFQPLYLQAVSQDQPVALGQKIPDGVYRVLREGASDKDVLPLRSGEAVVLDHARYLKQPGNNPPRFLVVPSQPAVPLALASEPVATNDGAEVRIQLKLQPTAAAALEKVTREYAGGQLTIVLKNEVVTTHKIRAVITDGDVQITSCAVGAADYLLKQLRALYKQ